LELRQEFLLWYFPTFSALLHFPSENSAVSGNSTSENAVSENEVSENAVSDNQVKKVYVYED
jgi:hypothetical protein